MNALQNGLKYKVGSLKIKIQLKLNKFIAFDEFLCYSL